VDDFTDGINQPKSKKVACTTEASSSVWGAPTTKVAGSWPAFGGVPTPTGSSWGASASQVTPGQPDGATGNNWLGTTSSPSSHVWGIPTTEVAGSWSAFGGVPALTGTSWGASASGVTPGQHHGATGNNWLGTASTTPGTLLSFPTAPKKTTKTVSSRAVYGTGKIDVYREIEDNHCYMNYKWGNLVKMREIQLSSKTSLLDKCIEEDGKTSWLIAAKLDNEDSNRKGSHSSKWSADIVKAYYLEMPGNSIERELSNIADFSALSPSHVASRLELLTSPARCSANSYGEKQPYTFMCESSELKETDEKANMGCGFIPPKLLEELLGNGNDAHMAAAVQVRLFSPSLGIFKGLLMKKHGIKQIQLPPSMKKVNGSQNGAARRNEKNYLLFNNVFPSKKNKMLGRFLNPNLDDPPPSSEKDLENGGPSLGKMVEPLLLGSGVPAEVLRTYQEGCGQFRGRKHAWCLGVADPTDSLPEGSVFVSGRGIGQVSRKVFVTRNPCTQKDDGVVLTDISTMPVGMTNEDWMLLSGLHFGIIVFAAPSSPGARALPSQIAGGDLDGDLYFVLWDEDILSYLPPPSSDTSVASADVMEQEHSSPEDNDCDSDSDSNVDELLGSVFQVTRNGKSCEVYVFDRRGDAYMVNVGDENLELSRAQLTEMTAGLEQVVEVLDHCRMKSGHVQVSLKSIPSEGKTTEYWSNLKFEKKEIPVMLAKYAKAKNLLQEKDWAWANKYIKDVGVVKIVGHRKCKGKSIQVEVLWTDKTETWEEITEMKESGHSDALVSYARENQLLRTGGWKWVTKDWFDTAQTTLVDALRLLEISQLTKALSKAHTDRGDINESDSMVLGLAYKDSLNICKHGGKVTLPFHLRNKIKNKKLHKYIQIT
jgi:hypothetical protein